MTEVKEDNQMGHTRKAWWDCAKITKSVSL